GSDALFRDAPRCAMVMPVSGGADARSADMIETVVMRHFAQRLHRVIAPDVRRSRARAGAYDLADPIELARFAQLLDCSHGLTIIIHSTESAYAIAWAARHIGLTVALVRLSDETILWSARHALDRSAGGLPTGPLSLVFDTAHASAFASDRDGTEALVEDVVRQVAQTFPDLRQIQ
ncbi:MAG: hypothetical protein P8N43_14490, partial [Alphaproteobacteria bacterium]|nr:hypothetical protein [Alphaproteobacteria bacterium]